MLFLTPCIHNASDTINFFKGTSLPRLAKFFMLQKAKRNQQNWYSNFRPVFYDPKTQFALRFLSKSVMNDNFIIVKVIQSYCEIPRIVHKFEKAQC